MTSLPRTIDPMSRRWKLGLVLWGVGMVGAVALTVLVLPELLARMPGVLEQEVPPLPPMGLLVAASLAQTGVLLALAVWAGVALAPSTGLRAPAFEALVSRRPALPALRPQFGAGIVAGVVGGLALAGFASIAPPAVQAAQDRIALPLFVRMLYGGITEELLLRWGLMTVFVWLAWRFLARRTIWVWAAIVVSSLVFAAGHLPAAAMLVGTLSPSVVAHVIGVNTLFGLVFGWLYWRHGLEAAMLAHALTHLVSGLL